jgi:tetratricopeptide (TPR) repeat protein
LNKHGNTASLLKKRARMSALAQVQILPPSDWQAFERASEVLFRRVLNDPYLKKLGKAGQEQYGLDLTGYENGNPSRLVGVQCKCVERPRALSAEVVKKEVSKAAPYVPQLAEYIIVTTADDHAKLDKLAHELTEKFAADGRTFPIRVWGWNTLQQRILEDPAAIKAFSIGGKVADGIIVEAIEELSGKSDIIVERQDALAADNSRNFAELDRKISQLSASQFSNLNADTKDHSELDRYRLLIREGKEKAALSLIDEKERNATELSATVLSRLKSLAGHCYWHLGELQKARNSFIEAERLAPEEPRGVAAGVLADVVIEDYTTALEKARHALQKNPKNEAVTPWLLLSAARVEGAEDPSSLIDYTLRGSQDFREAHTDFLRCRDDRPRWWLSAREGLSEFPSSDFLKIASADAELDEFLQTQYDAAKGLVSTEWRGRLEAAAKAHEDRLDEISRSDAPKLSVVPGLAVNVVSMLVLLDQFDRAKNVLNAALILFPDEVDLVRQGAKLGFETNDAKLLDTCLPKLGADAQDTLLRILIIQNRGDWPTLAAFHNSESLKSISGSDGQMARLLVELAKIRLLPKKEQHADVRQLIALGTTPAVHLFAVSRLADELGMLEEAEQTYLSAANSKTADWHIASRMNLALLAEFRRDWRKVVSLLDGHLDTDVNNAELRLLARSIAQSYPVSQKSVEFFHALPSAVAVVPYYREMKAFLLQKAGDTEAALEIIQEIRKEDSNDAQLIIWEFSCLIGLERSAEATQLVMSVEPDNLEGRPDQRMTVAHILAEYGRRMPALHMAFDIYQENQGVADLELKYCGLFLNRDEYADEPEIHPTVIADGCWVSLVDHVGTQTEFLIDCSQPRSAHIDWPQDPRATQYLGLKVGEVIENDLGFPIVQTQTVRAIEHRYLRAFKTLMETFNVRHPGHTGLVRFSSVDGDIAQIIDVTKARAKSSEELAAQYKSTPFPIAVFASGTQESAIELLEFLESWEFGIHTCIGNAPERLKAVSVLKDSKGTGVTLDLSALWTLLRVGALGLVRDYFGHVYISNSAYHAVAAVLVNLSSQQRRGGGTTAIRNGQFFFVPFDPRIHEERKALVAGYLDEIRTYTERKPIVVSEAVANEANKMFPLDRLEHSLDPIFLAIATGTPLMSEELLFREFARLLGVSKLTWLQPIFMTLLADGKIEQNRYSDFLTRLAAMRHGYLSVDARSLASTVDAFPDRVGSLLAFIGTPNADIISHVHIASEFADIALARNTKPTRRALSQLLFRLATFNAESRAAVLASVAAGSRDRSRTLKYLKDWCGNRKIPFSPVDTLLRALLNRASRRPQGE